LSLVHLHVHDRYSPLEGIGKPSDYVELAKEQGHPALAITNLGNLFSVYPFYTSCKEHGVKPILGQEFYLAENDNRLTDKSRKQRRLVVLAKNQEGWKNLVKLSTIGYLEGRFVVPRIDSQSLANYSAGLIVLSGGLKGILGTYWQNGEERTAQVVARQYREIFGDDFYLETLPQPLTEQADFNRFIFDLAQMDGFKVVAANDCRYPRADQAALYDYLIMIKNRMKKSDMQNRSESFESYFKTEEEMLVGFINQGFDARIVQLWLDTTVEVASKVDEITFEKSFKLPAFREESVEVEDTVTVTAGAVADDEDDDFQFELMGEL
jgi:DNA polymerase-3 subunit alpha